MRLADLAPLLPLLLLLPVRVAHGLLSLPPWLRCVRQGVGAQAADVSSTIYSVLSRALPGSLENAPVPQLGDDELGCSFQELLGSAAASPALFQLLQRQAHLILVLSDLGRIAGGNLSQRDLVLDPWLWEHCRQDLGKTSVDCGDTFAEVAAARNTTPNSACAMTSRRLRLSVFLVGPVALASAPCTFQIASAASVGAFSLLGAVFFGDAMDLAWHPKYRK
ncbi:TUBD1 [Symbiodinium natans]|uniref:TUBD1 protein n=1 Tax=Symbiodinium natans TaxID=878477 RepID=A0A812S9N6_9DINO|nr:TUBD1 [Symbiodinium natans]